MNYPYTNLLFFQSGYLKLSARFKKSLYIFLFDKGIDKKKNHSHTRREREKGTSDKIQKFCILFLLMQITFHTNFHKLYRRHILQKDCCLQYLSKSRILQMWNQSCSGEDDNVLV